MLSRHRAVIFTVALSLLGLAPHPEALGASSSTFFAVQTPSIRQPLLSFHGVINPAASGDWLLRLAVPPAQACNLLAADPLQGVSVCLAAGSGIGDGWASGASLARHRVEALRRHCQALGGYLSVLRQPTPHPDSTPVAAWLDAPSKPLIEAVKRQFDPKQQLARGRLPGVAQPGS